MKRCLPTPLLACLLLCTACGDAPDNAFPGYAEGEYVRLSAPLAGTLSAVRLRRGDRVAAGTPAYVLEQASETAAREEAQSRVGRAEALLADLRKGARRDDMAALEGALREAEAAQALSQANLARERKLVADHFIAPARLDQSAAALAADRARVEQARARLRSAGNSARSDQVAAAEKEVDAARAQLAQAQWRVDQKVQATPVAGMVSDVAYRAGEWVPAGAAIITLLPPANIKARFFVPETMLGKLRVGQGAVIACDGCAAPLQARITYISPEAEYTSPLIYSKENRASLVFMVEASPVAPSGPGAFPLHPGQPLTVSL